MSSPEHEESPYETLGLPPDATMDQVRSRFRELNDAYLKILQASKSGGKSPAPGKPTVAEPEAKPEQKKQAPVPAQPTRTEPISRIKARLSKGEIQQAQFEKLAKERYEYLKNKPFTDLTDSEFEERLHGFEGLKFL